MVGSSFPAVPKSPLRHILMPRVETVHCTKSGSFSLSTFFASSLLPSGYDEPENTLIKTTPFYLAWCGEYLMADTAVIRVAALRFHQQGGRLFCDPWQLFLTLVQIRYIGPERQGNDLQNGSPLANSPDQADRLE